MKYNQKTIEQIGVDILSQELNSTSLIDAKIATNYKTISWDGDIYLYTDTSFKKESLIDVIPIQVKSNHIKDGKYRTSFPIELADINNYKLKQKIIYFHVQFSDKNNYKIYYKAMLLLDIKKYWMKTLNKILKL